MWSDQRLPRENFPLHFIGILIPFIFLFLFSISMPVSTQEVKHEKQEPIDQFSYLIENGAKMIRENEYEKVLNMIGELSSEKKADFKVGVIENFAYLKSYLATKNKEHGKKWKVDYKSMVYSGDKTATPVLIEFLQDVDPYVRLCAAKALAYIGDERALEELKRVAGQDTNSKVRSIAKWAYEHISGGKFPKESIKED